MSEVDKKIVLKSSSDFDESQALPTKCNLSDLKVVKNPVYGIDIRRLKHLAPMVRVEDFNSQAKQYISSEAANSGLLIPTRELFNFRIVQFISLLFSEIPKEEMDSGYYKKVCLYFSRYLLTNQNLISPLTERAKFFREKLNEFTSSSKRSTVWTDSVISVLDQFIACASRIGNHQENPKAMIEELERMLNFSWRDQKVDKSIKAFLINAVFINTDNNIAIVELFRTIGNKPKSLIPMIEFLAAQIRSCALGPSFELVGWSFSHILRPELLGNISAEGVIRNYFPDGGIPFKAIRVNKKDFPLSYNRDSLEGNRRAFFDDLLSACYQSILPQRTRTETDIQFFIKNEVNHLLRGMESQCTSLRMLSAGTLEAWYVADRMIRFMFPGITSMPFHLKIPQGTELEINTDSHTSFSVVQRKKYQICLRSKPLDDACFHCLPTPLCTVTFEWCITSQSRSVGVSEEGRLKIADLQFAEGISTYEHREILHCLSNPKPLPEKWEELLFPSLERTFPKI